MGNDVNKPDTCKATIFSIDENHLQDFSIEELKNRIESIYNYFINDPTLETTKEFYLALCREDNSLKEKKAKEKEEKLQQIISNRKKREKIDENLKVDPSDIKMKDVRKRRIIERHLLGKEKGYGKTMKIFSEDEEFEASLKNINSHQSHTINEDRIIMEKLYRIICNTINLKIHKKFHRIFLVLFNLSIYLASYTGRQNQIDKCEYNLEFLRSLIQNCGRTLSSMIMSKERKFEDSEIYVQLTSLFIIIIRAMLANYEFCAEMLLDLPDILVISQKLIDKHFLHFDAIRYNLLSFLMLTIKLIHELDRRDPPFSNAAEIAQKEKELRVIEGHILKSRSTTVEMLKNKDPKVTELKCFAELLKKNLKSKHQLEVEFLMEEELDKLYCQIEQLKKEEINYKRAKELIRAIIFEYHNSTLFIYSINQLGIENGLGGNELQLIVETMLYLTRIDFVLTANYIDCEREIKILLLTVINSKREDRLIDTCLIFLIQYHYNSFRLHLFQNFSLFNKIETEVENCLFDLFATTTNDDIKYHISLLFLALSIIEPIWVKLKRLNLINPTSIFIYNYLGMMFTKSKSRLEDSLIEKISLLVKVIGMFCDENNFRSIMHIDIYSYYLKTVLLLFYVYHDSYKKNILGILQHFTFYYSCKLEMLQEKNYVIIQVLQKKIFTRAKKMTDSHNTILECIREISTLDKKKKLISNSAYQSRFEKNKSDFEDLLHESKNIFLKRLRRLEKLGQMISILLNLTLMNDFENKFEYVFIFKPSKASDNNPEIVNDYTNYLKGTNPYDTESKEKYFGILHRLIGKLEIICSDLIHVFELVRMEGLSTDQNDVIPVDKLYVKYERCIYQFALVRMITSPFSEVYQHELEGFKSNNDKDFQDLIAKYYEYDYDIFHKIIFAINRYITYRRLKRGMNDYVKMVDALQDLMKIEDIPKFQHANYECLKKYTLTFHSKNSGRFSFIEILYKCGTPPIINREILRLLCSLTMFSDSTILWCRLDSTKYHLDYANANDILVNYKSGDPEIDFATFEKKRFYLPPWQFQHRGELKESVATGDFNTRLQILEEKNKKILNLPYFDNVMGYGYEKNAGIITYNAHFLQIPKVLQLPENFTISFKYFTTLIFSTKMWYTLLQSPEGLRIVAINKKGQLGCFTQNGEWIDSKLSRTDKTDKFWRTITICYQRDYFDTKEQKATNKISFYSQIQILSFGVKISNELEEATESSFLIGDKYALPSCLEFIGNSFTYQEPFGIFYDLRIYNGLFPPDQKQTKTLETQYDIFDIFTKKDVNEAKSLMTKSKIYPEGDDETNRECPHGKIIPYILKNFLNTSDESTETVTYTMKFFNNILSEKRFRKLKFNSQINDLSFQKCIVMKKIFSLLKNGTPEIKKEVAKFYKTIE